MLFSQRKRIERERRDREKDRDRERERERERETETERQRDRDRKKESENKLIQLICTTDRYNPVDLHVYDPDARSWTVLPPYPAPEGGSYSGRPSFRDEFGFTAAGGKLYVHGGWSWFAGDKGNVECISKISGERDRSIKPIRFTNCTYCASSLCLV